MVDDQDKALKFYTEILGFLKKHDIPLGGPYRWITVTSPEGPADVELSIEPNANPAAKTFQEAMFSQKIPLASFEVDNIDHEYARLKGLGVVFLHEPAMTGPIKAATFSDTCGNLIHIYQMV